MHVKAKQIAFLGLLAAFSVLLLVLGAVFEVSTLFFICGAAFCVGIAVREWGIYYGAAFLVASTLTGLIVAPNKIYCITYGAMGLYLLLSEILFRKIAESEHLKNRTRTLWIGRYMIFNVMYVPAMIFVPQLFVEKKIEGALWGIVWIAGQAGLWIFEKAHDYFQLFVWNKLRKHVIR